MLGSVVILGATGQTGSSLLTELLSGPTQKVTKVVAYGNSRPPVIKGQFAALATSKQASMALLATDRASELQGFDCIFFHIGTQRRKAGLEAQIKLELDDTLAVARAALQGGCKQCHIVSSMGSSATSSVPYLRTKGKVEAELRQLGFERLVIYRPGVLCGGDRATWLHRWCVPGLAGVGLISAIPVSDVGRAIAAAALRPSAAQVEVLENHDMLALARSTAHDKPPPAAPGGGAPG